MLWPFLTEDFVRPISCFSALWQNMCLSGKYKQKLIYEYLYTDYTIFEEENQKYSNLLGRNRNFSISPIHFHAPPPSPTISYMCLSLLLPREYSYRVRQQCLGSHTAGRMDQNTVRFVFKNRRNFLQSLEIPKEPDSEFEEYCDPVSWAVGCFHCTGLLLYVRIYWYGLIKYFFLYPKLNETIYFILT
jgi:hypothetical protein